MSLIRYLKVPLHKRCTSDAFYRAFHSSFINNNEASKSLKTVVDLPKHARVVICGGGVTGSSIAYHLAERGWNDVVLLEQGK